MADSLAPERAGLGVAWKDREQVQPEVLGPA